MAFPRSADTWTAMIGRTLGTMCRNTMLNVPHPARRAASTNSRSRSESTWLRARRVYQGQNTTATATMVCSRLGPSVAAMAAASTKAGKAKKRSVMRISTSSTIPPTSPAMMPSRLPNVTDRPTIRAAEPSEMRAPAMMRLRTSRPTLSVPRRWAGDGGARTEKRSAALGDWASSGPRSAARTASRTIALPSRLSQEDRAKASAPPNQRRAPSGRGRALSSPITCT